MTWVLGLTGGAGSGKSTAAEVFRGLGIPVVDADAVSRSLTAAGGAAVADVAAEFGAEMILPDGAMDRTRMRELVFGNPDARARLERIVHGHMEAELGGRFAAAASAGAPFVVYDCPLLVESPRALARADRVLVIDAPEALQIERLGSRSGLSPETARRVLAAQASRSERLAVADDVIVNAADADEFRERVLTYARRLLDACAEPAAARDD